MANAPKFEARIVIPTGGWSFSISEQSPSAGPFTVTLAAAETFYHSSTGSEANDLAAEIQSQLNAASAQTYTVTVSAGAGGTGKYTISVGGGATFTITWTSTDFRDVLGWTSAPTTVSSSTSENHAQGLWIPGCPCDTPYGLTGAGVVVSESQVTVAGDGTFYRYEGDNYTRNEYTFAAVSAAKTLSNQEGTTGESFETFWLDAVLGQEPWANAGRQIRFYADADTDATFLTQNWTQPSSPQYERATADWDGLWRIRIEVVEN